MDQKPAFASGWAMIAHFMRPYRQRMLVIILLFVVQSLLLSAQPLVMAPLVDVVLGSDLFEDGPDTEFDLQDFSWADLNLNNIAYLVRAWLNLDAMGPMQIILLLSAIYMGVTIAIALVDFISFQITVRVRVRAFRGMQKNLFGHLLDQSFDFHNHQRLGDLMARFDNDIRNSIAGVAELIKLLIVSTTLVLFYGYMLLRTNLRLTVLMVGIALLQWFLVRLLRNRLRSSTAAEFKAFAEVSAYIQETFQNIRVVKGFTAEGFERTRFAEMIERILPIHWQFAIFKHIQDHLAVLIAGLVNVTVLGLAAVELFRGNLSVTGFALFLYVGRSIINPITQLAQVYVNFQSLDAAATRALELFNRPVLVQGGSRPVAGLEQGLRFDNLSFSYESEPVLRDVSFEVQRGEIVALVGPSGAGKSTIADLVLRFYDPDAGRILLDGVDIRELKLEEYRRLFGIVAQENLLFNDTVAANIAYAQPEMSVDEIRAAAQVANADEFIANMPEGYQSLVGDRGVRVSGGQRQRIAIARAVARQPQILILDEATSSLDTESERLVQDAIDRVIQNTTAIIVAHRLSTVMHADKIVVMQAGQILDIGKHDELYTRCELYHTLCDLQFTGMTSE